jgi:uncharacterized protein DUF4430
VRSRIAIAAAAALACAAAAGCGLGAGDDAGEVELRITRGGSAVEMLAPEWHEIRESDTVLRLTERNAEVETSYGGGFVDSIDGVEGGREAGRLTDWFYSVNGIEVGTGAADYTLHDGERVWWYHREWNAAQRIPVNVGAYPEPLLSGYEGEKHPVTLTCFGRLGCEPLQERLADAGVELDDEPPTDPDAIRILAGPWDKVREDPAAQMVEEGPATSGVFAEFVATHAGWSLALLNTRGVEEERRLHGAALVAAVRIGEQPPVWLVTGTDEKGYERAQRLVEEETLDGRYAVGPDGIALPLP